MRVLKVLFTTCFLIGLLILSMLGFYELIDTLEQTQPSTNEDETQDNGIKGANIESLNNSALEGELVLSVENGLSESVIQYKLSSGRIKNLLQIDETDSYEFDNQFIKLDNYLFWIEGGLQGQTIKQKSLSLPQISTLYTVPQGYYLIGLKVVDKDNLYFSIYKQVEAKIEYKIIKLEKSREIILKEDLAERLYVYEGIKNSKVVIKEFNLELGITKGSCLYLTRFEPTTCAGLQGDQLYLEVPEPEIQGFLVGTLGYIKSINTSEQLQTILTGTVDEAFQSPVLDDTEVYFISGQIQSRSLPSDQLSYGVFRPVALEKINKEGLRRTSLLTLPANSNARIVFVDESFVILEITEENSDKVQIAHKSLWLYRKSQQRLEKLQITSCEQDASCDVSFVAYIRN